MITFETQAEFEDAVMLAIGKRLGVRVTTGSAGWYNDDKQVSVELYDTETSGCFSEDSATLPTPKINY